MEKSKKKRSSYGRKKRIQLDGDEGNYSRNYSNSRPSESSTSTRHPAPLRSIVISPTGSTVDTTVSAPSLSGSLSALPTSCITTRGNSNTTTESKNGNAKTPPTNDNRPNPQPDVATTSSPPRPGSTSPEPNCAICLGKLENKSFTDSCFHQFCFVCLVEWSKVKAECPLCKQSFKSIVHNVRSFDDYDQYHIPTPEDRNQLQELVLPGGRFRYRTTGTDHRYATLADRINREIESRLLQRPSRSLPIPSYRRLRQPANSDFRRSVYLQRLKLTSQQLNTRKRVRETSPTFFRENPAQTHRLVPWLNRELNALLQGHGEQTAFVLDLIMGLIKRFPIDSEEFYQHVFPYTGRNTRQFMHEFLMFAKSPYQMAAYDRHSSYGPSDEPHHDSDSNSDHMAVVDDDNDSDVIVVSPGNSPIPGNRNNQPPPPRREDSNLDDWETSLLTARDPYFPRFAPIMRTYRNEDLPSMHPYTGLRHDDTPTSASGWDSPTPGPSQLRLHIPYLEHSSSSTDLSNSRFAGGSIWTPSSRSFSAPNTQPLPSTSSIFGNLFSLMPRHLPTSTDTDPSISQADPVVFHTESDSNSSDIEIVEVEKPWNERSPIRVSSGGETDYDVMITGTTHVNDPIKTEKKKKKHKRKHDESSEWNKDKRKRSREISRERHSKKRRPLSRSRSPERCNRSQSRSRTRSLSPLRLRIFRAPDYQHKKFGYKTHNYKSDETLQYCNSRSASRSRSPSSLDSDSESHVSITAHRRSSKSKHSSIEIVEYRKKSSKLKKKKHKKNKGKGKSVESINVTDSRSHKHKKHSKSAFEHASSELHGSHKKHKSKGKKHHKEKKQSESKSEEGKDFSSSLLSYSPHTKKNAAACIYTSDSDPDSVSEMEGEQVADKIISEYMVKSPTFGSADVEFVELNSEQAVAIDQELDSINKTLAQNDYINSLLKGENDDKRIDTNVLVDNDPNRDISLNEDFNQRAFKKHPYGHKKSSKSVQRNPFSLDNTKFQVQSSSVIQPQASSSSNSVSKLEDNIQSHDISSCSEIDMERQLPSFLTFSNRNSGYQSTLHLFDKPQERDNASDKRNPSAAASYDSPTSSGLFIGRENEQSLNVNSEVNNFVDVDTISDDSDIDVTGEFVPVEPNSDATYISNTSGLMIFNSDNFIDVVGDSDDEQMNYEGQDVDKTVSEIYSKTEGRQSSNDIDVENGDSDIECSFVEGHKTFEIAEDSESENKVEDLKLPMRNRSSPDIDVIGNSDDEIIIDADKEWNETGDESEAKNLTSIKSDAISNSENGDMALASLIEYRTVASNNDVSVSDSDTDRCEKADDKIGYSPKHVTTIKNVQLTDIQKGSSSGGSISQGNGTEKYNLENYINNYVNDKRDKDHKPEQNMTKAQTLCTSADPTKESESTAEKNADVASSSAQSTVTSEHDSNFTWTASLLYESRPLSITDSSYIGELGRRDRSISDQEYIINLPSDRTPSWERVSPDSIASVSSPDIDDIPEWWERNSPNSNQDYLPED